MKKFWVSSTHSEIAFCALHIAFGIPRDLSTKIQSLGIDSGPSREIIATAVPSDSRCITMHHGDDMDSLSPPSVTVVRRRGIELQDDFGLVNHGLGNKIARLDPRRTRGRRCESRNRGARGSQKNYLTGKSPAKDAAPSLPIRFHFLFLSSAFRANRRGKIRARGRSISTWYIAADTLSHSIDGRSSAILWDGSGAAKSSFRTEKAHPVPCQLAVDNVPGPRIGCEDAHPHPRIFWRSRVHEARRVAGS